MVNKYVFAGFLLFAFLLKSVEAINISMFESGETWVVCQGYNTGGVVTNAGFSGTHEGNISNSLDLSYQPNDLGVGDNSPLGATFCLDSAPGNTSYSDDRIIYAPSDGTITIRTSYNDNIADACIELDNAQGNIHSIRIGHLREDSIPIGDNGVGVPIEMGDQVGHIGNANGIPVNGFPHVHIQVYTNDTCEGASVDFGNFFGEALNGDINDANRHRAEIFIGTNVVNNTADNVDCNFNDLDADNLSVSNLCDDGIIEGYADGSIELDAHINRAEFSKIISRSIEGGLEECDIGFTDIDVSENQWFLGFIRDLFCRGHIVGYSDGSFRPGNDVTYAESIKMIMKAVLDRDFHEEVNDDGNWYDSYFDCTVALGWRVNINQMNDAITRGEVFNYLHRARENDQDLNMLDGCRNHEGT